MPFTRMPSSGGGSGYKPRFLPTVDPSQLVYDDNEVIRKSRRRRRQYYMLAGFLTFLPGGPAVTVLWLFVNDSAGRPALLTGTCVSLIGLTVGIYFQRKVGYSRSLAVQQSPSEESGEEDLMTVTPPAATAQPETSATATETTGGIKPDEMLVVLRHLWPRLRLHWQRRLPAIAVFVIIAVFIDSIVKSYGENVSPHSLLVLFALAAIASYAVLRRTPRRFVYKPDETNIGKEAFKSLQAYRGELQKLEVHRQAKLQNDQIFMTRIHTLLAQIIWLVGLPGMKLILLLLNHKGTASKSTIALYLGSILAYACHVVTLLFPATENKVNATAASMSGIDMETALYISDFIKRAAAGEFQSVDDLMNALSSTADGLRIIAEDRSKDIQRGGKSKLTLDQFRLSQYVTLPKIPAAIFDGGNDDADDDTIPVEAARIATAIIATSNYDTDNTIDRMGRSMYTLHTDYYMLDETTDEGELTNGVDAWRSMVRDTLLAAFNNNARCIIEPEITLSVDTDMLLASLPESIRPAAAVLYRLSEGDPNTITDEMLQQIHPKDGRHCSTRYKIVRAAAVVNRVPAGVQVDFGQYIDGRINLGLRGQIGVDSYISSKPAKPANIHEIDMVTLYGYLMLLRDALLQSGEVLGIDTTGVYDITADSGYHPQKQKVDDSGGIVPRDNMPSLEQWQPERDGFIHRAGDPLARPVAPEVAAVPPALASPVDLQKAPQPQQADDVELPATTPWHDVPEYSGADSTGTPSVGMPAPVFSYTGSRVGLADNQEGTS